MYRGSKQDLKKIASVDCSKLFSLGDGDSHLRPVFVIDYLQPQNLLCQLPPEGLTDSQRRCFYTPLADR